MNAYLKTDLLDLKFFSFYYLSVYLSTNSIASVVYDFLRASILSFDPHPLIRPVRWARSFYSSGFVGELHEIR